MSNAHAGPARLSAGTPRQKAIGNPVGESAGPPAARPVSRTNDHRNAVRHILHGKRCIDAAPTPLRSVDAYHPRSTYAPNFYATPLGPTSPGFRARTRHHPRRA
ncbi:hypothetical protein GCM10020218_003950 [Dactylosporangium vinaceum]